MSCAACDAFFITVLSACLAVHVLLGVCFAWATLRHGTVKRTAASIAADVWRRLRTSKPQNDSQVAAELARRVEARRLAYAERFLSCVSVFMSVNALGILTMLLNHKTHQARWTTLWQDGAYMLGYVGIITVTIFPRMVNPKTLNWVYSIAMAVLIVFGSAGRGSATEVLVLHGPQSEMLSLTIGVVNLRLPFYTFWNAMYAAATIYRYSATPLATDIAPEGFVPISPIAIFVQKTLLLYVLERSMAAGVRRELEAHSERSQRGALTSLLGIMCEAVVELDSRLLIAEHVPALANTLLHGVGKSLQGLSLQGFIPEREDRDLFERHVREPDQSAAATVFHGRIRDALGNRLRMEFFHVPFRSVSGAYHHLVGLREHVDFQESKAEGGERLGCIEEEEGRLLPMTGPGLGSSAGSVGSEGEVPQEMGVQALHSWEAYGEGDQEGQWRAGTAAAGAAGMEVATTGTSRSDASQDDNMLQVDVRVTESLPITYASPKFEVRFGEAPRGGSFADWLSAAESDEFFQWVSGRVDASFSGMRTLLVEDFGYLTVTPRTTRNTSPGRLCRPGPRLLSVLFPDPVLQGIDITQTDAKAEYRVSVRIGKRPPQLPADCRHCLGTAAVATQYALSADLL